MSEENASGGEVDQGTGKARMAASEPVRQTAAFIDGRTRDYLGLWENAGQRLSKGEYTSSDLITDWFSLWAKGLRDTQALAKAWGSVASQNPSVAGGAGTSARTIFNDCPIDLSREFGRSGSRPLEFTCSDIRYRLDDSVAVQASNVTLSADGVDRDEGTGFVRATIDAAALKPGLLQGFLFESGGDKPIGTINMSVPPGYSRY